MLGAWAVVGGGCAGCVTGKVTGMETSPAMDSDGGLSGGQLPVDLGEQIPATLLEAWRAQIRRWYRRKVSGGPYQHRLDTSDVVQESLIQLWRDRVRFRGATVAELRAWMYRIAGGHLAKLRRHHRAVKRSISTTAALDETDGDQVGQWCEPSQDLALAERRLALSLALERLEEPLATVVKLRVFAGMAYKDIGTQLGCDAEEARNCFLRALRRLRSLTEEWRDD